MVLEMILFLDVPQDRLKSLQEGKRKGEENKANQHFWRTTSIVLMHKN